MNLAYCGICKEDVYINSNHYICKVCGKDLSDQLEPPRCVICGKKHKGKCSKRSLAALNSVSRGENQMMDNLLQNDGEKLVYYEKMMEPYRDEDDDAEFEFNFRD